MRWLQEGPRWYQDSRCCGDWRPDEIGLSQMVDESSKIHKRGYHVGLMDNRKGIEDSF